jgi:hypothetical protein
MTVFIAGSISIKRLTKAVIQRLDSIIAKGYDIVVGDAGGVDKAVQRHLHYRRYHSVTVYCINQPRNNIGEWPVESVTVMAKRPKRTDFAKKDRVMAERADVGFMIWDDRSPGTLNNVLNLLSLGKHTLVYLHSSDELLWVMTAAELRSLVERIPPGERETIDEKIGLSERMRDLTSAGSYEVETVSHSVQESQLDLFGIEGDAPGDPGTDDGFNS